MSTRGFRYCLPFVLYFLCLGQRAVAYEYSVKNAFCQDYARNRTRISSSNFRYELQVSYNSCMKNANTLIRRHEESKENQLRRQLEDQRKRQADSEKRRKQELQKQREEAHRKEIYNQEMDRLIENADNLFR